MRGLSFYAHAVGTAAFPGLVLADGLGFSAPLGALRARRSSFAFGVERLARRAARGLRQPHRARARRRRWRGGVVLASDVFHSGGNVDSLLFGSLLLIDDERPRARRRGAAPPRSPATLPLGPRWLARGLRPGRGARAGPALASGPTPLLLVLVAFAVVGLADGDRRAAGDRAVRRPGGDHAAVDAAPAGLAARVRGARGRRRASPGCGCRSSSTRRPGRPIAVLGGARLRRVAAASLRSRRSRARRAAGPARALLLALVVAACGGGAAATAAGLDVVATTTQIGDWARAVGGDAATSHQILQPNTDPHDYEPRPADVQAVADAELVLRERRRPRRLDGRRVIANAGGSPEVVDLGAGCRCACAGESEGDEASRFDPHWWHDPRNAAAAVEAIRDALVARRPRSAPRPTARTPTAYLRQAARARRAASRRCLGARARGASASSSPTTTRSATSPHRYGIAVVGAVIPSQTTQAQAVGGRHRRARARSCAARACARSSPRSSLSPKLAEQIARETGARADYTLYGDTLGPGRLARRDVPLDGAGERRRAWRAASRGGARGCRIAGIGMTLVAGRTTWRVGYGGRPVLRRARRSAVEPGAAARRARARTAAASRRCCAPCSASSTPLAGQARAVRRAAASCRRPSARGSTTR